MAKFHCTIAIRAQASADAYFAHLELCYNLKSTAGIKNQAYIEQPLTQMSVLHTLPPKIVHELQSTAGIDNQAKHREPLPIKSGFAYLAPLSFHSIAAIRNQAYVQPPLEKKCGCMSCLP